MLKKSILIVLAAVGLLSTGCYNDKEELLYPGGTNCNGSANRFSDVNPIVQTKCAFSSGCHGAGSTNSGGVFMTHAQMQAKAAQIKIQVQTGLMPQTGSLTAAEKQSIICWVNAGAPNN